MAALSISDLTKLKSLAIQAMNAERKHAEAAAGADFVQVLASDIQPPDCWRPRLSDTARTRLEFSRECAALADRVGIVLDEALVAADGDGTNYPAAHARVRDRAAAADPAKAPF